MKVRGSQVHHGTQSTVTNLNSESFWIGMCSPASPLAQSELTAKYVILI